MDNKTEQKPSKDDIIKQKLKAKKAELTGQVKQEVFEEKQKKLKIPKGDLDFNALSKEHGYVQARNMLRQAAIQHHQKSINKVDQSIKDSFRVERIKEAMVQSYTSGEPNSERPIDKIIEAAAAAPKPIGDREETQLERQFNADIAYRRAIIDGTGNLVIPQYGLEYLPACLGDTLFLQTLFLKNISLPRNKITTLFSHHTPQLSAMHLRYIRTLNLQGNKIKRLSGDVGNLASLTVLNVADNVLSTLPASLSELKNLVEINLMGNSFCEMPQELCWVTSLRKIIFKKNIFVNLPTPLPRLVFLEELDFSHNMIYHLAIQPPLLKPENLWKKTINMRTGGDLFVNIITKEAIKDPTQYNGRGIELATELHEFQRPATEAYRRRKTWLLINQIHEFDPAEDEATGWTYYKNNVSGDTVWDMPKSMDTLGMLENLTFLDLSYNFMRSICDSLCRLKRLKKLLLIKNRLHELPERIGDLKCLEHINVHGNEIHLLPVSICECESLKELLVEDNQLIRLPEKIGYHEKIEKIICTANRMKSIPFSIGYNKSIKSLNFMENPLEDPPVAEVYKGLEHLKWYLRSRMMLNERGAPPAMEFHDLSTMLEVTILKPELMQRVISMCEVAKTNGGFLNLQSMGIGEVPREILKVKKLKKLILDNNNTLVWTEKHGIPKELSMLKALSMKVCGLTLLPDNLSNLKRLSSLCCEENRLESLPASITKLKSLTDLDVPKNRIYAVPDRIEYCTSLKYINFEDNFLSSIPNSLGSMKSLLTLNIAKNRLIDLPNSLCGLKSLKKLNAECNKLKALPVELNKMKVIELRVGHNQIEFLEENLFSFSLGKSIMLFSFCENNILELPNSLAEVSPECHLEPDFNPLISPPPFLLAEGLETIQRYLFIRKKRLNEIAELLDDEDFVFVKDNAIPQSFETLEDGTGFLTPADLLEFDQAVDEYVNGEYYRCPASGEEIVQNLVKLREFREVELYHLILNTFISTIEEIVKKKDKRFGDAVLLTQQRPWGRKGEMCNCWVLSLAALLRDAPVSQFHKQGRESVFSMIQARLPVMAFPFTVELLKDAMRLYFSPFGQVADTEQVTFPGCDCVDDKRYKPLRHSPCTKPAIVIVKTIYVEEEVSRREVEEEEYMELFKEVDMEVTVYLNTEEGIEATKKEIKLRDAKLAEDLNLRTEMLDMERFNLSLLQKEMIIAKNNKEKFERGDPFSEHNCENIGDAIAGITAVEDKIELCKGRQKKIEEAIVKMKTDQAMDLPTKELKAADDLIQKYIFLRYQQTIKICRTFAAMRGLRRPWDGDEGKFYKKWLYGYVNRDNEVLTMKQLREREEQREEEAAIAEKEKKGGLPGDHKVEEYTWEGCDNMLKYTFPLYLRYMTNREAEREEEAKNNPDKK